ncbi:MULTISPECIES: aminoglycoside 6-adenylyltransferase [Bacillus]|uniref:Aminoglycoside 6-adenylyltransferase n=4 Tax=Bacillus cereus group TaxID=86661 RepID=A0AAC8NCM3_BACAN|nr:MULTISPECIES: aminoglycoside 6-adenylyltransferase [Bacillus]EJT19087.1 Aminoglycoside 6-adenylyltransferase [Bacillus anthracis str. UR-1]AAP25854.1 putative aminoglycoside 6-adenylyltransferase [Bacillus anthracis str. Ames]AAT31081.1 putative aminoglycoside 6-adenylyltransferase [Bacillus anthracis str. 'Ames Ancestor']AAT54135.1 aminoglycoside 6-adenylyltransferase, putative [Bacillus anthracis str. Sterne]ACP13561.1 putative aminoglycoside 6-adenylyltransferase [Bacillus anthracis str.
MRTEKEMIDLIMNTAKEDERIRAVIMNGSRVNPNVKKDCFQDFDIIYAVKDIRSFTSNHNWIHRFGEIMIVQMPEEMSLIPADEDGKFPYLMQFMDGNRIDLTLAPVELINNFVRQDSLSKLLLDKDNCMEGFPPASDKDYLIKKPTEKEFLDCCNEFWWCSTNVAKGLWREELSYVKGMLDGPVRDMLIVMLEWHIGMKTDFIVNAGKFGKHFEKYIEKDMWVQFKRTFSNAEYENIWESFFDMGNLFREVANEIANAYGYPYPQGDDDRVTSYLKHVKALPKDSTSIY